MNRRFASAFGAVSAALVTCGSVQAADTDDEETVTCVGLRSIDRTVVLDDQNILFYMRPDKIYLNHLRNPAPGLRKDQPFMYETTSTQLCANDIIIVLERWPFGLTRRGSGSLGRFEPIDEDRADMLRNPDSAADDAVEQIDIPIE